MDMLRNMNNAMQYIEDHLTKNIDYKGFSEFALCSEYHFKRMFSFLAGMILSECVRKRRLTLAAFKLTHTYSVM
ncbi:AraC-like DNA-binding protein [Cytobacillus purgationiresistens]|uniref:AraC-like DNA-binding protein n=1 Tax=Cytobacillus purgationiresistens TaxID=863449 RepID=A0ABU0AAQ0_9BACI|nr:AraC-like DNA-binding protein [Cytobacillus purgationiresistens]